MTGAPHDKTLPHDTTLPVQISNLHKHFREHHALRGLNFSIRRGEVVGLLGPRGAGKTTVLRILSGYVPPSSGSVRIAGYDVAKQARSARMHVGYLPENAPLYPDMSVADFLKFAARLYHVKNVNSAVERALGLVRLTERAGTRIDKLSQGQKRRVGIARAIIHEPDVLCLDAPTTGLDPRQILEMRGLLGALAPGRTILLATRSLPEVVQTCTRALILCNGALAAEDTPPHLAARMSSADHYFLRVENPAPEIPAMLERIQGVLTAHQTQSDGYEIETTRHHDRRAEIAGLAAAREWGVLELQPLQFSLQEVFSQLTTQEPDVEAVRAMNEAMQYG